MPPLSGDAGRWGRCWEMRVRWVQREGRGRREAWVKGIRRAGEEEGRAGAVHLGSPGPALVACGGLSGPWSGQGVLLLTPSSAEAAWAWCLRKQMDSAGPSGSTKTLLPQDSSYPRHDCRGGHSPKDSIKVKARRVHSLCCGLGLRLVPGFTETVSVSPPLNMAWPQTPSVNSKILNRLVYPQFSVILSFSPPAGRCYIPPGSAPGPLLFTLFVELLVVLPLAPCSARKDFGGRIKEARVL